jgi:hypothetical protein
VLAGEFQFSSSSDSTCAFSFIVFGIMRHYTDVLSITIPQEVA